MSQAILSTLLYHSIFDYPLTADEIHRYLISEKAVLPSPLKKEIDLLVKFKKIISNNNLLIPRFQIHDSRFMISLRLRRQKISAEKMIVAKRAAETISMIPWIKMVAITGALAMENADKNDDIDLMVVVSRNRLWIVRPLVVLFVSIFFKRRRPLLMNSEQETENNDNAICLNLWIDEGALEIQADQRNLYTAHEFAQMKPIVNKDGTYEKIMWENRWGRKYLANVWGRPKGWQVNRLKNSFFSVFQPFSLFNLLNLIAFNLQFQFMKPKMTNERVSLHSAFFHPGNRADTILNKYDCLCHRHL